MKELRFDYAISKRSLQEKPEGKEKDKKLSTMVFRRKEGTIGDLAKDISSGYVTATGCFSKEQFKWEGVMSDEWEHSNVIVIDVDNGSCKFDEFKNKLTYRPTLITTSSSYLEASDDEHSLYKYHCYYVFDDKICSEYDYQRLYDQLDQQMEEDGVYDREKGEKDRCGSSVAHLFFGNINTTMAVNADVTYRLDMFPDAPATELAEDRKEQTKLEWEGFEDKDLEMELLKCASLRQFVQRHWVPLVFKLQEDENAANEWGVIPRQYNDLTHIYFNGKNRGRRKWEIGSGRVTKLIFVAYVLRSWGIFSADQLAILLANWVVQMFDPRVSEKNTADKFNGKDIYRLVKKVFQEDPASIREQFKARGEVKGVAISRSYRKLHPEMSQQAIYGQWVRVQNDARIGESYDCNASDAINAAVIGVSRRLIADFRKRHNITRVNKGEITCCAVEKMTKDGWSVARTAEILGVCSSTVYKYRRDILNHKYSMKQNYDTMINNMYMYYPQMMDRPTSIQERKKNTDALLSQDEQIAMNYDWGESIRRNVELLKEKGIDVSKSTLGRWVKQQKENKTDNYDSRRD